MAGPIDNLLGIHGTALSLHRARIDQIASNIANADTPGYLARDLDFQTALQRAAGGAQAGVQMARTAPGHLATQPADGARLNTIEQADSGREANGVLLKTTLSELRDVDYARAISQLNLEMTALQAAQQSFVRVQNLSLFNYLR